MLECIDKVSACCHLAPIRFRFCETEVGFRLVLTVLCILLRETKPVFQTIPGHGSTAEPVPRLRDYIFTWTDEDGKFTRKVFK